MKARKKCIELCEKAIKSVPIERKSFANKKGY